MAFLEGDAVELVPLDPEEPAHVDAFRRSRDDPAMRATGYYGQCLTPGAARERVEARQRRDDPGALCAIRAEGDAVGWAAVELTDDRARVAELAYYVLTAFQGRGYASEAAALLVGYALDELNAHSVVAKVQAGNDASERVLEKLGFQQVGRQRDNIYKGGAYHDVTVWDVLDVEFERP
ncbi:MAG: GNAT family N-acetyltransferase [Haloarculaceae archaeon]